MVSLLGENLYIFYENILVINDIKIFILEGKIIILIGLNGCGKFILLKFLLRLIKFNKG